MKGQHLPAEHHVGIHCTPKCFLPVDEEGKVSGVSASVFRVDEDGISGNWLEFSGDGEAEQFSAMCTLLRARRVKNTHLVGVMHVGSIVEVGADAGKQVHVEHDPIEDAPANPGHCLTVGFAPDEIELLEELTLLVDLRPFAPEPLKAPAVP